MPSLGRPEISRKLPNLSNNNDKLKIAKEMVEKAIKNRKVFTIRGGFSALRHSLRKRGWVEKFYSMTGTPKKTPSKNNNDDDDDDLDDGDIDLGNNQSKIPPWEEDDGIYGIMSRILRNITPTFIWVLKMDAIDFRSLTKEQIVNHYCNTKIIVTKGELCANMRNVPWFDNSDPDTFYPRSYRLGHEEEKEEFIDDYRLTACVNILKIVSSHYILGGLLDEEPNKTEGEKKKDLGSKKTENDDKDSKQESKETEKNELEDKSEPFICTRSRPGECAHAKEHMATENQKNKETEQAKDSKPKILSPAVTDRSKEGQKKKKRVIVPLSCLERAMQQCNKYLMEKENDDIDVLSDPCELTTQQWDELIRWQYQLINENGVLTNVPENTLSELEKVLRCLKVKQPQFELDGTKNVWIIKPGAKSRGRGIACCDRIEDMLKLVNSLVVRKHDRYVVQKYIERPLLIYNTKFDIRQWFLVTDWNPLTIWFYLDSYLRFCSQEYTLDDLDESIHISNYTIQKHYKNGPRSSSLPADNMWTHEQFKDYIRSKNHGNLWDTLIYPGMKKAIISSLLSAQDVIENRKSSFELYGADIMLTEDYQPWLIEINSDPSMSYINDITANLCSNVLEDTIKVVLDRKYDKNCDIGRFELAYKQALVTAPPYVGINLRVDGQTIQKTGDIQKDQTSQFVPNHKSSSDGQNHVVPSSSHSNMNFESENSGRVSREKKENIAHNVLTSVIQQHASIKP